jgi:hypothetical protein
MQDGEEVTLAGTRFRVEVTPCSKSQVGFYTKLHPVTDPVWHLRFMEQLCPREKNDG